MPRARALYKINLAGHVQEGRHQAYWQERSAVRSICRITLRPPLSTTGGIPNACGFVFIRGTSGNGLKMGICQRKRFRKRITASGSICPRESQSSRAAAAGAGKSAHEVEIGEILLRGVSGAIRRRR